MARSLRLAYEGAIYHVTARGNERGVIFRDDGDCTQFLTCLAACVETFGVRLYLFCLMTNHFHLVVETPRANLSAFMHSLQTRYETHLARMFHRDLHELERLQAIRNGQAVAAPMVMDVDLSGAPGLPDGSPPSCGG